MIGIMNVGSDSSVEFYASARASSLYERKPSKDSRTYTTDGRVLINGVPEVQDTPDDLWRNLIYKAVASRVVKEAEINETGPLAVIRKFSSRLRFGRKSSTLQKKPPEEEEKEEEKSDREHVTIIRIKTVKPNRTMMEVEEEEQPNKEDKSSIQDDDGTGDELRIYAQEGILKRLMEEKAMIERQMGNISMEWGSDSARTSIDEESDIIVERF
ncbi:hypothetical protein NECAME_11346 [Necator americanus]|uniref:Uncharacterized protein n=1 Tax=Necator americanus TaxID=51031 RepID=W2T4S0_NECAM|nr:hypothetical protein NECAME_11346 [Necator americanus]ETN77025.1 hypothetical protein NECAME_11346 [Necator americanus]